jgi:hypothetical protein
VKLAQVEATNLALI